ncbi:aminomethyl-transferring glycine dehydrogenase [Flavobacteriaceae bacterium]|nr:aminomethyl-transferring glycine dehydrogenase [Flavobacteriaceae bacterium]MDB9941522.1 aminomethyl-transferring glycine dehydrogenase [Flavobacteriaceae bacterium]MDC1402643.1 aminomethyl-transferring glycine dehydrogenase [Flavobacteriaceae bacterium]
MFANRHLGPNEKERAQMLKTIGVDSIATLIDETIPADIRLANPLDLPEGISEYAYQKKIQLLSNKNKLYDNYIGMGYHPAIVPAVIQRNILENPGWYTAYTPYQAEIAQGRLEALFNYQTVVTDLTGMELANASLLDESTAAAEAMSLLFAVRTREQKKSNANQFFVAENTLPQTLALLRTRATPVGIEIILGNENDFTPSPEYFGAFFQYPGKNGAIIDLPSLVERAKSQEIKTVIAADLLSLTLLEAPGKYGVDVVVGTTQRFGIPLGYGGPHAAYFATKQAYKRNIPGRIIGQTRDMDGKPALRMALQTREQHIKRDRATSNICTAQVLLAVMAGMYAAYHGPEGLKGIAEEIHNKTKRLESILNGLGIQQNNNAFFDTLHVNVEAKKLQSIALENEINLFYPDASSATISLNEATTPEDFEKLVSVFYAYAEKEVPETTVNAERIPTNLKRESPFMTHPVFNSYHSETALMRYIKKLERKDLALNHSMISLGSCTMKLNAASEMLPLSSPQWGSLHPFSPLDQVEGYQEVLNALTHQLNIVTGFAATSLQPNSGAQGEYSGLMVIRAYHLSRGDNHRDVCIIPASAHGTNPASAVMAGMEVVVTKTDERGNINWDDLQDKVLEHKDRLSALMVTYPSTHGVFEANIKSITALIHEHGGQVYMDGANMNAQVGLTSPAAIGADVCHLNLHKTFAIPHGGGGPGVGPICVAAHLAPFLPTNPIIPTGGEQAIEAISAAPWGSALACLISYGYIEMLGSEGLQQATEIAILNANYIKERIDGAYPVLYVGDHGRSAHELIIDLRPFKEKGIEVVDVAKRLMDYGFHAPTVSFPVAGTMMIEPTESENLAEIDRFCDAMISIAAEIASSDHHDQNSLLKNAPHTLEMATVDEWTFNYSRKKALYPLAFVRENKFWPTVRRVDEAFGDRNLICSCPSVESYSNN